jgi:hypothetical protein
MLSKPENQLGTLEGSKLLLLMSLWTVRNHVSIILQISSKFLAICGLSLQEVLTYFPESAPPSS